MPTQAPPREAENLLALLAVCITPPPTATDEPVLLHEQCRLLVERGGFVAASITSTDEKCGEVVQTAHRNETLLAEQARFSLNLPIDATGFSARLSIEKAAGDFTTAERTTLEIVARHLGTLLIRQRQTTLALELESRLRQLSRALDSSFNGVMITSSIQFDHPIVYVNPAFEKITGYRAEEVIGRSGRFLIGNDIGQRGLAAIRDALRHRRQAHAILRNYRKDGSLFWNELFVAPIRDESGSLTTHFVSIINDISERIDYEQQLEYHANHDPLTGLANRNLLNDRIAQSIVQARAERNTVGLLLIDLDRFKWINESLGHGPANEVLRALAKRLREHLPETITLGRLAADQFVAVIGHLGAPQDLADIAQGILKCFAQALHIGDKEIVVSAAVGGALYPQHGEESEALLRCADIAMHQAKTAQHEAYCLFCPVTPSAGIDRLTMESELRHALQRNELEVHYQPLIDLGEQSIIGAEALVRWRHPRFGLVMPGEFIPLAEENGLIADIGEHVLEIVCRDIKRWRERGLHTGKISLNLSARQFRRGKLVTGIRHIIERHGLGGDSFAFELTESVLMHDLEHTSRTLKDIRALGAEISLDDFGTGYSSLAYLRRLPIDILKIDRSFIRDLHIEPDAAAIAHAVIAMAHRLGLRVVAEGVECAAQLDGLREFQCDAGQGFFFSHPLPAKHYSALLETGRPVFKPCSPIVARKQDELDAAQQIAGIGTR